MYFKSISDTFTTCSKEPLTFLPCRLPTQLEVMFLIFYIFWKHINNMPTVLDLNSSPS